MLQPGGMGYPQQGMPHQMQQMMGGGPPPGMQQDMFQPHMQPAAANGMAQQTQLQSTQTFPGVFEFLPGVASLMEDLDSELSTNL